MIRKIEAVLVGGTTERPIWRGQLVHDGPFSPWVCEHEHPTSGLATDCARQEAVDSGETMPFAQGGKVGPPEDVLKLNRREGIAHLLQRFPEVRWDRTAGDTESGSVFGWIGRSDGLYDFLVLEWQEGGAWYVTSSARYSEEFGRRLGNDPAEHRPCQKVEDVYPGANLARKVAEAKAEAEAKGQAASPKGPITNLAERKAWELARGFHRLGHANLSDEYDPDCPFCNTVVEWPVPELVPSDLRERANEPGTVRPGVSYAEGHNATWPGEFPHVHSVTGFHADLRSHVKEATLAQLRAAEQADVAIDPPPAVPGGDDYALENGGASPAPARNGPQQSDARARVPGPPEFSEEEQPASRLDALLKMVEYWVESETATPSEQIRNDIRSDLLPAARAELERLRDHDRAGHGCAKCSEATKSTVAFVNWQAQQISRWRGKAEAFEHLFRLLRGALGL